MINRIPNSYLDKLNNLWNDIEVTLINDNDDASKRLYEMIAYLGRKSVQMNTFLYTTDIINFKKEVEKRKKKTILSKYIKEIEKIVDEQIWLQRFDDERYEEEMNKLGRTVERVREPRNIGRR